MCGGDRMGLACYKDVVQVLGSLSNSVEYCSHILSQPFSTRVTDHIVEVIQLLFIFNKAQVLAKREGY